MSSAQLRGSDVHRCMSLFASSVLMTPILHTFCTLAVDDFPYCAKLGPGLPRNGAVWKSA